MRANVATCRFVLDVCAVQMELAFSGALGGIGPGRQSCVAHRLRGARAPRRVTDRRIGRITVCVSGLDDTNLAVGCCIALGTSKRGAEQRVRHEQRPKLTRPDVYHRRWRLPRDRAVSGRSDSASGPPDGASGPPDSGPRRAAEIRSRRAVRGLLRTALDDRHRPLLRTDRNRRVSRTGRGRHRARTAPFI